MNTARNEHHEEPVEFIRLPEVKKLVGFGTTKIYTMAAQGLFPKQVQLGARSVAWVKSEVLQWNSEQLAAARRQPSDSSASK
ncbi:AlpA family transcriptional regulator [Pseudomonas sp. B15(2017)]|uniref:helix-turn-helix transcriptional regulator n=1 Tax=Pseudomonas sp. B15(2017) TaxID=1981744 RepID=UPI000A1EDF9C|nr:AlpA family phage regulatory protein [Pseudomonas sp. B15(2017)]